MPDISEMTNGVNDPFSDKNFSDSFKKVRDVHVSKGGKEADLAADIGISPGTLEAGSRGISRNYLLVLQRERYF